MKTLGFIHTSISSLIVLTTILMACSCQKESPCPDICFTPPGELRLRIIDKNDSTDLIFNGYYNSDSLSIIYYNHQVAKFVSFEIIDDSVNHKSQITSSEISWISVEGTKNFLLHLNTNEIDTIYLDIETAYENCCTFHPWIGFTINGKELEIDMADHSYCFRK